MFEEFEKIRDAFDAQFGITEIKTPFMHHYTSTHFNKQEMQLLKAKGYV